MPKRFSVLERAERRSRFAQQFHTQPRVTPRQRLHRRARPLAQPGARQQMPQISAKERATPIERREMRLVMSATPAQQFYRGQRLEGYYPGGMGKFSLRRALTPPRKLRKFIAKHKTALLVGAGILTAGLLAPAAAGALIHGAVTGAGALARGAIGAGKIAGRFVAKEVGSLVRVATPHNKSGGIPPIIDGAGPVDGGGTEPTPAPTTAPPPAPSLPDLTLPSAPSAGGGYGGGGGAPSGGEAAPASDAAAAVPPPQQAGFPIALVAVGLGLLVLPTLMKKSRA